MNDARRSWGARYWTGLAISLCTLALIGCSNDAPKGGGKDTGKQGTGDCEGAACANNAPPIDWSKKDATYNAHLLVVDTAGEPVEGAVVRLGNKKTETDKSGRARVGPLEATAQTVITVEKEGSTPQLVKSTAWTSSRTTQTAVVTSLGVDKEVDGQKPIVETAGGVTINIPDRALATSDGNRVSKVRMEMSYISPEEADGQLLPGDLAAVSEVNEPTFIESLGGAVFVRFRTPDGQKVNLAPGQVAHLMLPLGASYKAKDGEVIPLWSLDEVLGRWRKESSCTVSSRKVQGQTLQFCVGVVDHFSYWAYGREIDIFKPGTVGCMNVTAEAEKDACYKVRVHSYAAYQCDDKGEKCQYFVFDRQYFTKPPEELESRADVAWCGVFPSDGKATYRISLIYDTDTSECGGDEADAGVAAPSGGRRSKVSDPIDLESFQKMLGSELMLNFTLNGDRDCPTLCAQVPFVITEKDLESPPWTDRDNDGYFATTDDNLKITFQIDCNDDDPKVHPRAPEPFCVLEDRNCDGKANKEYKKHTDIEASRWNASCRVCKTIEGAFLPLTEEVAGNPYDEDCDGYVLDADDDGYAAPEDCWDYDERVNPGRKEIIGNSLDDDCDGMALDWDNDGEFSPSHIILAKEFKLDPAKFTDCDDYSSEVKASNPPSKEAQFAQYYYKRGNDVRRTPWFCELFYEDGSPSAIFHRRARDLNCDGYVTDLDGDGFTRPGDPSLGEGMDIDCDDYDPRVRPLSKEDPTCEPRETILNDSVCNVQSRRVDGACPILTVNGTDIVTVCEEAKDQDGQGTGIGVCTFPGWWGGNPLVINPGTAWGPCDGRDGTEQLKPCPTGAACGGELPYTDALTKYLEDTYLEGEAIQFKGMCFPGCTLEK